MSSGELVATGLCLGYRSYGQTTQVVADVSLELRSGRLIGLAGESGCGKSTLALALTGFRVPGGEVLAGDVELGGTSLTNASRAKLRRVWGAQLAYLPQQSASSLNPALTIGTQFADSIRAHERLRRREVHRRVVEMLERVQIPDPQSATRRHPHQFSGGQQERIALAMALACRPRVLILDEPGTGLDVRTLAATNALIVELTREMGTATLYVSHNLAMLAMLCDELAIMYAGEIVEHGPTAAVYSQPRHPYTAALIRAVPRLISDAPPVGIPGLPPSRVVLDRCAFTARCAFAAEPCAEPVRLQRTGERHVVRCVRHAELGPLGGVAAPTAASPPRSVADSAPVVLAADDLRCVFRQRGPDIVAVEKVSFELRAARVLGIAGESGSGKSTVLRAIAGLVAPTSGQILFAGEPLSPSASSRPREHRRAIQLVFQNPDLTLNPRHTVFQSLERPLALFRRDVHRSNRREIAAEVLQRVHLGSELLDRLPQRLSGGQRQRVAIARALAASPEVILCDEVTSALDVSVQASILDLLIELRDTQGVAIVFVTHDLGLLRAISDEVVVMESGVVREVGSVSDVLLRPRESYTRQLLAALPDPLGGRTARSTGGRDLASGPVGGARL